ncbi:MAG: D-alanyl-D-alanine carboxypeptidase, partial [Clostridia bacterium]|nr:D-alanyl-D-alanine carboxypeptidase [Clostridia bacterium]
MKKLLLTLFSIMLLFIISTYCATMQKSNFVFAEVTFAQTAKSSMLIDFDTGTIVHENQIDKKLPIASMVKMMTIFLTLKSIDEGSLGTNQKITTTENASGMGGSQVFIDPYVEYTVEDLLKSVIMSSANDASVALAEAISGSEDQFVVLMNDTAKNLGMNNTVYANCTGLPAPEQYSCARDCAVILKNILKYEYYHKFSNIWMDELVHPSGRKTELVNTNKLVKYYDGCDCGKTGSTSEAGYCLTASAKRGNLRLISVIIGAQTGKDRFKETTDLFNYGFANFENKQLVKSNDVLKEVKTKSCKTDYAQIISN